MNASKALLRFSAIAIFSLMCGTAHAAPRYRITEIQPLSGDKHTGISAINDKGQVVAVSSKTADLDLPSGRSFLWDRGNVTLFAQPPRTTPDGHDYASAYLLNNRSYAVGDYHTADYQLRAVFWKTPNAQPVMLPVVPQMDQYYVHGLNDLGLLLGYVSRYEEPYRQGFLYDMNSGRLSLNNDYIFGEINNRGSMIRGSARRNDDDPPPPLELVTPSRTVALSIPANNRGFYDPRGAHLSQSDVVVAALSDDDNDGNCSGCGTDCVRWEPPSYNPVTINPPNFGPRDYCGPSRPNSRGDMVVYHQADLGEDEYVTTQYVYLAGRYYNLSQVCPELARFEADSLWIYAINERGQIIGQGVRDNHYRGFILDPL